MNKRDVEALQYLEHKFKTSKLGLGEDSIPNISQLISGLSKINSFVTLYDFTQGKYIFHHRVEECTGYNPIEFTIDAIRNDPDSKIKMVHPDDIQHKSRFEMILFEMVTESIQIKPLSEHTEYHFRIIKKNGEIIKVSRQSFLFETLADGTPLTLLEKWKIIPHNDDYVKIYLFSDFPNLEDIFYAKNRAVLDFKITDRQIEIIKLRNKRLDNQSIANFLNISLKTVENHIRLIKQNIQDFYDRENIEESLKNMSDVLHFIKLFSIFPL